MCHAKLTEQSVLANSLARLVIQTIILSNNRISCRIIDLLIYSVEYSAKLVLLVHKLPVKTM